MPDKTNNAPGADTAQQQNADRDARMKKRPDADANGDEDRASQLLRQASTPGAPGAAGTGDTRQAASGPSPYDLAGSDMPPDRVIKKGERERPGPTADELDDTPDDEHTRRLKAVQATEADN